VKQGLVLFAHGARDARWKAPFEAVAERARAAAPAAEVRLAFLELMTPDIAAAVGDLVAAGCRHIHVVPLFLGSGGHVRHDLPLLLDALRVQHAGTLVELHPAVGEAPAVIDAMAAFAVRTLQ